MEEDGMTEDKRKNFENRIPAMGWLPDYPDFRDYTFQNKELLRKKEILDLVSPTGLTKRETSSVPTRVDLRRWCSPIEDQGDIGSCTAHAGVGIVEYYERKAFNKHIDASRLFLYKVTRRLSHLTGDSGAYLRKTMGGLVLFGVPPEEYWPYSDRTPDFDKEPDSFCYSFAENYKMIKYFRHDTPNVTEEVTLKRIKQALAASVPSMFGFTVYGSINQVSTTGKIPYPCRDESSVGGHAIVAVGYDDKMSIENGDCGLKTKGALLIRNSWGKAWGDEGYGWLPYDYVLKGLAIDFWSMLKQQWVDTGQFSIG
jgi:C1A family cysteine protease